MDGVIVDNMAHHTKAWKIFLKRHAPGLKIGDVTPHFGKNNTDLMSLVFGRRLSPAEVERWGEEKEALYREIYAEDMAPLPGLVLLLKRLRKKQVRTVIATSAPRINVDFILDGLNLRAWFDAVVDASEIEKGKPDPEIYLKAAEKAGCLPENCLVFEDSIAGIQAGISAGMKVIGVATTLPAQKLKGTDLVIKDFSETTVALLIKLIRAPGLVP
jgi:HAD superfamily hydrolase (TIGR01509 family)